MKRVLLIGMAMAAMAALPAYAGFNVVTKPKAKAVSTHADPASIGLIATRFVGRPTQTIGVRHGFGRDVPLKTALQQIAPPGWHTQLLHDEVGHFDPDKKVDWHGGRPWTDVLDILASDQGFTVDVYWLRHLLLIGRRLPAPATPKPAKPAVPKLPVWLVPAGSTLRDAVTSWCKTAGWHLRWSADINYPVAARLTFRGTFKQAIRGVFNMYQQADQPLYVDTWPLQKLVIVSTHPPAAGDAAPVPSSSPMAAMGKDTHRGTH